VAGLKWAFWMMAGLLLIGITLAVLRGERRTPASEPQSEPITTKSASD